MAKAEGIFDDGVCDDSNEADFNKAAESDKSEQGNFVAPPLLEEPRNLDGSRQ